MGVEKNGEPGAAAIRLNKTNSIDLYRPPALRRIDEQNEKFISTQQRSITKISDANYDHHHHHRQKNQIIIEKIEENNVQSNANNLTVNRSVVGRRERRPDRAVYIPRARRSLTTPPQINSSSSSSNSFTEETATNIVSSSLINNYTDNIKSTQYDLKQDNNDIVNSTRRNHFKSSSSRSSLPNTATAVGTTTTTEKKDSKNSSTVISFPSSSSSSTSNNKNNKNYYNKNCDTNKSPPSSSSISITTTPIISKHTVIDCCISSQESINPSIYSGSGLTIVNTAANNSSTDIIEPPNIIDCDSNKINNIERNSLQTDQMDSLSCSSPVANSSSTIVHSNNFINMLTNNNEQHRRTVVANTTLRIEDIVTDNRKLDDKKGEDKEIEELQRASKEINRSNRCIMKQTFNSDILEIPESNENDVIKSKSQEYYHHHNSNNCSNSYTVESTNENQNQSKDAAAAADIENDDWDSIFDDNGECIDPKILSELTASVGKVKIETPKNDYKAYHVKQSILNDEEFPHVLEISNFPVEFKTQDLMMIFSVYKESGFDIKWVDDTHALVIFSSSRIAAEVLAMGHPFVVLKPLAEATIESRAKAKKCSSSLQPYRPRPETCAALARRLVTGALGVRLKTAAAERENEKRVLREAKERKLLAAKQRNEAWES